MRTKFLRGREGVTIQLVYPSTLDEYRQALDALAGFPPAVGVGDPASVPAGSEPRQAAYVVTTAQQRHLWDLPDLAVSGGVVPVDEARALYLLYDAARKPYAAVELFPARFREVDSGPGAGAQPGAWFDAVRDFLSPAARFDEALGAINGAGLPAAVHEPLSETLTQSFRSGSKMGAAEVDRLRAVVEQKDGASAGVALVAALVSSFTGRPVRADLAMTGEITLSGHVLSVAGVKEKVMGACRRGLTHVVLPRQNEKHFEQDVGDDVRRRITVHYVRRIDDLLELVLRPAEAVGDRRLESSSPQGRL